MKKRIVAVFMASVMAGTLLLTACGSSDTGGGESKDGETITLSTFDANPYAPEEFEEMVSKFEEAHPGVEVEIQHAANDSKTLLQSRVNSGDIPDVFAVQSGSVAEMYYEYACDWTEDEEVLEKYWKLPVRNWRQQE